MKVIGVEDTLALLVVTRALVSSYPTWVDEYGTNIEQLAEIAVAALGASGLLSGSGAIPHPDLVSDSHLG